MTAPLNPVLGGTDKAAIMVMLLAEEDASRILGQLTPDELRQLAGTMCGIGEIDRREQFFGAMSSRAADGLRDEIEMRGRVKKTEVETAQKEIVAIAKRLIAQGDLMLGEGDEDYV